MPKIIRLTTVPISMNIILRGQLGYIARDYEVVGVTSPDDKHFPEVATREGIRMIPVKMERGIAPLRDVVALWQLIGVFRRERPEIVHTHTPKAGLLGIAAAWLARVPIRIHTLAGLPLLETEGTKRKVLELLEKVVGVLATKVYPNSFGLRDILIEQGLYRRSQLKVLGHGSSNGIDLQYFNPNVTEAAGSRTALRRTWKVAEEHIVFVFVGRIAREKGIGELVAAFDRLYASHSSTKLVLVGPLERTSGPVSDAVMKVISSHPGIYYEGREEDIRPSLLAADVFVFPSYREGFPNVLLQAGAMGLPLLAGDINGGNEIVDPGRNGLLFPTKDTDALFRVMERAVTHPEELAAMRTAARAGIVKHYSRAEMCKAWKEEYEELLNDNVKS